jgi:beta-mannosidase
VKVSSNVVYFAPVRQLRVPASPINIELSKAGDGYELKLSSKMLARSVYVSFKDMDVKASDNYFDLLPNEPAEIRISSSATIEQLRTALKVMSLEGAFPAAP